MLYLDSSLFLYAVLHQGPKSARAADLLRSVAEGAVRAVTASLTVDEVVWKLETARSRRQALAVGSRILSLSGLEIRPVAVEEIRSAIDLLGKHPRIGPRDAIHAAVALKAGASGIATDDGDFDELSGLPRVPLEKV